VVRLWDTVQTASSAGGIERGDHATYQSDAAHRENPEIVPDTIAFSLPSRGDGIGRTRAMQSRWIQARTRQEFFGRQTDANKEPNDSSNGPLAKIQSLFGGKKSEKSKELAQASPSVSFGGPLGFLMKPMLKLMTGMIGKAVAGASDDVAAVKEATRDVLLRSGQLGSRVTVGSTVQQMYSSTSFNGQKTAQVQLQFQVLGETRSGMAACTASILPGGDVQLQDVRLDGVPIDSSGGAPSGVIDVDR